MNRSFRKIIPRPARLALIGVLAGGPLGGCERGILEVDDPDIVDPNQLTSESDVPGIVNGIIGDFTLALDNYIRYTGLFTDEFILSGTFPTRVEMDFRNVQIANGTLNDGFYELIHVARFAADDGVRFFRELLGEPGADENLLNEAIVTGLYYGAYSRVLLAEAFCQSILSDINGETAPLLPDARMQDALAIFQEAQSAAQAAGLGDFEAASIIGQARTHMWLRNFETAAALAATVNDDFEFMADYSSNTPEQNNDVYCASYGDTQCGWTLRWTVGAGLSPDRRFEIWPYFDEWVAAGLLDPDPPPVFDPQNDRIPLALQLIYGEGIPAPNPVGQAAPILIASGFEADMIEAEAFLRSGDIAAAAALVNSRTANGDNPHNALFTPVVFTADLEDDLLEMARARAAGLWLTGQRLGTLRRYLGDGVDFFPGPGRGLGETHPGSDTAFPMTAQEIDNNPNASQACPSGPPWS